MYETQFGEKGREKASRGSTLIHYFSFPIHQSFLLKYCTYFSEKKKIRLEANPIFRLNLIPERCVREVL